MNTSSELGECGNRLRGKGVVVTGATAGIGFAIAQRIANEGARVIAVGRRETPGPDLEALLVSGAARFVRGDVRDASTARQCVDELIAWHGAVDGLVNNAGVDHTAPLLSAGLEEVRLTFDVNVFGAILMLQACGSAMAETGGGSIVNITSRLASIGVPTMGLYGASKGALLSLTRGAAVELAPLGIRVNCVAPGMTRTPLFEAWLDEADDRAQRAQGVLDSIPQGRVAEPSDIAGVVAFLLSDDAAHITGTSIPVDGGYTAA